VLKKHGQENSENKGGAVVLYGTGGHARSLKQELEV